MLKEEAEHFVSLGTLKHTNYYEWGALPFYHPKAKKWVQFLSNFRNFNSKLKGNTYPMPRIYGMILKLDTFQYSMLLDLNIG